MPQILGCAPEDLERWAATQRDSGALQGAARLGTVVPGWHPLCTQSLLALLHYGALWEV